MLLLCIASTWAEAVTEQLTLSPNAGALTNSSGGSVTIAQDAYGRSWTGNVSGIPVSIRSANNANVVGTFAANRFQFKNNGDNKFVLSVPGCFTITGYTFTAVYRSSSWGQPTYYEGDSENGTTINSASGNTVSSSASFAAASSFYFYVKHSSNANSALTMNANTFKITISYDIDALKSRAEKIYSMRGTSGYLGEGEAATTNLKAAIDAITDDQSTKTAANCYALSRALDAYIQFKTSNLDVISINFVDGDDTFSGTGGLVSVGNWNNCSGASKSEGQSLNKSDGTSSGATVKWSSKNTWRKKENITDQWLKGYLDDGNEISVEVSDIPYARYSVIVYQATDTENNGFNPPAINGVYYSWDGRSASNTRNNTALKYGTTLNATSVFGTNAIRIKGLSGTLTLRGGGNANSARGCIAAVQIIKEDDIVVSDLQVSNIVTTPDNITYTGGAGASDSRVQIAHNGGSATLSGATYYLNQSNNATQTTVNFDGATAVYGDVMGIGTAIYNINNTTITTPKFITSQGGNGRSAVVNLTGNSVINVTGSTNEDTNQSSIMIGHWNGPSSVTLSDNAQISAPEAQLLVGKTHNNQIITLNGSSNITAKGIKASENAWSTNTLNLNGGSLTLGEVGITTYGQYRINVNVTEDATITATASTLPITQPVTIAAGKTLTIDGGESRATVTITPTPTMGEESKINFVNATVDFNSDVRDLSAYTFTNCVVRFIETGAEYSTGNFTVTNVPAGITTILVKKYDYKSTDDTEYYTATKTGTTATLSHEVGVSGSAAWLDYTFDTDTNPTGTTQSIPNAGNAGTSGHNLTIDTGYTANNSFNNNGTLKVKSTPWRDITWPTDYTVAVSANFPDVENGCLMAFGSSTGGSRNYLALVRGASSDEIKLVKGNGNSTRFTEVATMAAENATAADHLVVFTKHGNVFNVYLDGVNVTQTTYSVALGTGFQIGSLHGGVRATNVAVGGGTGLLRVNDTGVPNEAVYAKAVRVYDYVISDAQMAALKDEFPYISMGGSYSRTITADANLSASGAWYNKGSETNVDLPSDAEIEGVTYHPDVEITTSADATLTVNADMNARNVEFTGSNTLTIAGDGTHHLKVYGSVTANSPVIVKYGAADFSTVPVTVGASGSICFDFSAYDFSSVAEETQYVVTGNTSNYGDKITAAYPTDTYHTYALAHNAEQNKYILTVAPTVALKQQQAINAAAPYFDGRHVGTGVGKYTVKLGETSYMDFASYGNAVMAWETLSDCVTPVITINQPTSGYYMLKSKYNEATGYYLQCENKVVSQSDHAKQTTTTDASNIFYITVGESNSSIKSYTTGYYFGLNTYANYTENIVAPVMWTFSEGSNKGTYTMQSSITTSSVGRYLYGYSDSNKLYVDRNSSPTSDGHTDWILVPVAVEDLPVIVAPGSTDKNKKILGNIQTEAEVQENITAGTAFVDLSEATITGTNIDAIKGAVAEVNQNAIIIAPAGTVPGSATTNVLLKADEGKYTCNNLQLTDDIIPVFEAGTIFTGTDVTYNRTESANQWGTICLPYAVSTDGDVAYYRLVAPVGDQTLRFERVTDATTTAYEPYLIKKAADAGLTISASDAEFTLGNPAPQVEYDGFVLKGTMVSTSVINGVAPYTVAKDGYQQAVTDPNAYYFDASSNTFRALNGRFNLKAFRAYLTATGTASARSILSIDISEDGQSTGISFVESEDGKTVDIVYDLNGRRLQEAKKGINIINGKKVIK